MLPQTLCTKSHSCHHTHTLHTHLTTPSGATLSCSHCCTEQWEGCGLFYERRSVCMLLARAATHPPLYLLLVVGERSVTSSLTLRVVCPNVKSAITFNITWQNKRAVLAPCTRSNHTLISKCILFSTPCTRFHLTTFTPQKYDIIDIAES